MYILKLHVKAYIYCVSHNNSKEINKSN